SQVNVIVCHLGNGASITAVRAGESVDTSMGFTPLEGLVMGTRSGDFDPAILFYLAEKGYDLPALREMCNKKSGLLGISGRSNDMRTLLPLAEQGDGQAALAVDIFCYRVKKYIGAYTAVLGRLDAVAFTGGIGENAPAVREAICRGLEVMGLELDPAANAACRGEEADVATPASHARILVVPTDEEAVIAGDTYALCK
ncbi:MAG: acetate kinase, partial [Planctomycetes bacterium]|nr:acetate kinase [Planctomycetota bacterium]